MPNTCHICHSDRLVVIRYFGHVTAAEHTAAHSDLFANNPEALNYDVIVDLSAQPELDINFAEMMMLVEREAKIDAQRSDAAKLAIFAPDDVSFGMARMYQSLQSTSVFVTRCHEQIADYLGLVSLHLLNAPVKSGD